MLLVCHVISKDHVIKESYDLMGGSPSWQVTTLPDLVAIVEICGGYSGDSRDIMFLVVQDKDSTCFRFNPPFLFISKRHGLKALGISY